VRVEYEVVLVVMAVYVVVYVVGAVFVVDVERSSLERSSYRSCFVANHYDCLPRPLRD
jgi:hypothetical protein